MSELSEAIRYLDEHPLKCECESCQPVTKHLFRSQTSIVAMCGSVDRTPKTEAEQVKFEDLPTDGSVCSHCYGVVRSLREALR